VTDSQTPGPLKEIFVAALIPLKSDLSVDNEKTDLIKLLGTAGHTPPPLG
jgi:hypothetical protein